MLIQIFFLIVAGLHRDGNPLMHRCLLSEEMRITKSMSKNVGQFSRDSGGR